MYRTTFYKDWHCSLHYRVPLTPKWHNSPARPHSPIYPYTNRTYSDSTQARGPNWTYTWSCTCSTTARAYSCRSSRRHYRSSRSLRTCTVCRRNWPDIGRSSRRWFGSYTWRRFHTDGRGMFSSPGLGHWWSRSIDRRSQICIYKPLCRCGSCIGRRFYTGSCHIS